MFIIILDKYHYTSVALPPLPLGLSNLSNICKPDWYNYTSTEKCLCKQGTIHILFFILSIVYFIMKCCVLAG